jgi:hypothetical protein
MPSKDDTNVHRYNFSRDLLAVGILQLIFLVVFVARSELNMNFNPIFNRKNI